MTYSLRTAQTSDTIECVKILRDWVQETPWMPKLWEQQSEELFWRDVFEKDQVWIAEKTNRIVGFCARS